MARTKPWVAGLIDNLAGSNLIRSTGIQHRNRLALVLLDSGLEIAFKNFLEFEKNFNIPKGAMREREQLHRIVKKHTSFDDDIWRRVDFFYKLRCDLYHEESEKTMTDSLIKEFQELVELLIDQLFGIESRKLIPTNKEMLFKEQSGDLTKSVSPPIYSDSQNEIVVALRKFITEWQRFKEQGSPTEFLGEIVTIALHTSDNMRMLQSGFSSAWTLEYRAKVSALADELRRFGQSYTGSLNAKRYDEILSMGDDAYKSSCDLITMTYEES
jgi:hypothetical protein